ncbi:hypothetical protein K1T71_006100 [Dendrolimus kikuchii]|uniref:Uncharacterized protein n=1 Tax=Dendrolimus kikuchii TaxID=765133 RepID=A0ACC1D361_9NEOP|nr:hypothetical protein K1T71_006100 [Dendrolimus kikuchii]
MSKDIIVLTPNGRRQKVHCTPDTSILQVLEDVCQKQGFQPSDYDLKHHNHILDLTSTVRFSNLPNKAMLEMVEADKKRQEVNVTIGLLLEDGERRMADFAPNITLYDIITSLAPSELSSLQHPTILYMRQEVTGVNALREKTLRQLGLIKGRAILRLLNKAEEARQANVSAIYRRPVQNVVDNMKDVKKPEQIIEKEPLQDICVEDNPTPGPSNVVDQHKKNVTIDPIKVIKNEKIISENRTNDNSRISEKDYIIDESEKGNKPEPMQVDPEVKVTASGTSHTQESLERRLKIEEEVTFLGAQKAIAFMQPEAFEDEMEDLPDDFYELTIEEVRKLYNDLQQQRLSLENTPLITASKRDEIVKHSSKQKLNSYKSVVVRIQFPDHIILQGIFSPTDKIEDIIHFIKEHLENPEKSFHIFTTPIKETLDPKMTLLDAKFVPCVHMHFKWMEDDPSERYLKEEVYLKKTSSDAAGILASKYRAPSRRKSEDGSNSSNSSKASASTSKNSKVPKWFKN